MERALRKTLKDGAFKNVPKVRSRTMSRIKSRGNKTTELRFRLAMVRAKVRGWIVQPENVIGNPDFFFPEQKIAVFVDGCFWHGCPRCGHLPKTNPKYWELKILRNIQRDKSKRRRLKRFGFKVIRFWEHALKSNAKNCIAALQKLL